MSNLYIRQAVEDDFHDICLLSQELGYECDEQKVKERIKYILKNTKDIIFVARQADEVIGYIHGSPYELIFADSLVNILGVVVNKQHRNLGVGGKLMEKLESWAKENGFSGVRLVSGEDRLNAHKINEITGENYMYFNEYILPLWYFSFLIIILLCSIYYLFYRIFAVRKFEVRERIEKRNFKYLFAFILASILIIVSLGSNNNLNIFLE